MNRGLSHRPVFLGRPEIRYFLSRLAREVRRGEIEVYAYCLVTTHFHLLVRSPAGRLSEVMRRIENAFVRWFNRRHGRDGALFRGRFTSRRVRSERYRRTVVRYIDANPVVAGLVRSPEKYPHGSAWHRARPTRPPWLAPCDELGEARTSGEALALGADARWVVERRLAKRETGDELDDLLGAAPDKVRRWLEQKARVADGTRLDDCFVSPEALRQSVRDAREREGAWQVVPRRRPKDGWAVLEVGMCRDVAGLSIPETSLVLGLARSSAGCALLEHRRLVLADETYRDRAAAVLRASLEITFGGSVSRAATLDDRARLECAQDRA